MHLQAAYDSFGFAMCLASPFNVLQNEMYKRLSHCHTTGKCVQGIWYNIFIYDPTTKKYNLICITHHNRQAVALFFFTYDDSSNLEIIIGTI